MLELQSGVIARRQVLKAGWSKSDMDRMVRRREWVRLLPGIYIDHTGPPTWQQRAWAGVLCYWPAALAGVSALRATAGPGWRVHDDTGPIWVAVAAHRSVDQRAGYRVRWLAHFEDQVLAHTHPPRMRFEEACLDAATSTASPVDQVQLLAQACQSRRTTAARLQDALRLRRRVANREWLQELLVDIGAGTHSVLEHGYLARVERPHGLPSGRRQSPGTDSSGRLYRDVAYDDFAQYVELDGRLFHDSPGIRDADLERDLDAALTGTSTIRLGWGQVFGRPCRTAGKVAWLLQQRGWTGAPVACTPDCEVGVR